MCPFQISPSVQIFHIVNYILIFFYLCLSFFLQFLQDTFIIVTNPEVNFLTKVHELIEKFTGGKKKLCNQTGCVPRQSSDEANGAWHA